MRFIVSYRFLDSSLGNLTTLLVKDDFKTTKKLAINWEALRKKLSFPYEQLNETEDYDKRLIENKTKQKFSKTSGKQMQKRKWIDQI